MPKNKVSVVMAVYKNDKAPWLKEAIDSIVNQTLKADEIIVVVDGPIGDDLELALDSYSGLIKLIRLPENKGLSNALNVGIKSAKNNIIARMDADDISPVDRFEVQMKVFADNPSLTIVGGQILEFKDTVDNVLGYRYVPTDNDKLVKFSKRRSPFNHASVMYKADDIVGLGGYDVDAHRIEDYDLWLRLIDSGLSFMNIGDVLLMCRASEDSFNRRRTVASLKSHVGARYRFVKKGYIGWFDFAYGAVSQVALFVLPASLGQRLFNRVVRSERQ